MDTNNPDEHQEDHDAQLSRIIRLIEARLGQTPHCWSTLQQHWWSAQTNYSREYRMKSGTKETRGSKPRVL